MVITIICSNKFINNIIRLFIVGFHLAMKYEINKLEQREKKKKKYEINSII